MKPLSFILLSIIICVTFGCEKQPVDGTILTGKWKHVKSFYSIGGPQIEKDVKDGDYLLFAENGALSGDGATSYTSYSVKDSITLSFKRADNTIQDYWYAINDGILTLSPLAPIHCIEGCSEQYKKVSD